MPLLSILAAYAALWEVCRVAPRCGCSETGSPAELLGVGKRGVVFRENVDTNLDTN